MSRLTIVLIVGFILAVCVAHSPGSSASRSTTTVEPASAEAGGAITGTLKGIFHNGFYDYVQNYDATTTADIEWQEDPTFGLEGCQCRFFFPSSGTIDWTFDYEVVYSESESCTDSDSGQITPGAGVLLPEDQMLVLAEIPNDDAHYYFFGGGSVSEDATINCDGGFTFGVPDFFGVSAPDELITSTPVLPLSPASVPLCDEPIKVPRDARRITGSCYEYFSDDGFQREFTKYEWDLDVCAGVTSIASHEPGTEDDTDGDHIPNDVEQGIGTNPLCQDTDGDGLLDPWEVEENVQGAGFDMDGNGSADAKRDEVFGPYNGQCGTSGFGVRREPKGQNCGLVFKPDPLHKDVYVEMDWQDCILGDCPELIPCPPSICAGLVIDPSHHAPDMAGLLDVVNVFSNAPVENPDGNDGVNLHILVDEAIPHTHNCDQGTAATRPTNFGTVQQRSGPNVGVIAAKQAAFRYAWSGHSSVDEPGACPLPSFAEVMAAGFGLGPLPFYDISPHGFAQPRGRDILVTLAISWICQLYTFDIGGGAYTPPCFRMEALGVPVAPGLFEARIAQRGGGAPVDVPIPQHVSLGISPSQGVRQLWGRTFMNLLGYSMGVPGGSVKNDPTLRGARPPDSYTTWEDLDYAPPRIGPLRAQGDGDGFVPIFPDFTLAEEDGDGDGTAEGADNCPALANPGQADLDLDGLGDDCDDDDDGDSVLDAEDDFPLDTDDDGAPNAADNDADGDGAENGADNCPLQTNADQANADGDDAGDACDGDSDGDGQADVLERAAGSDPLVADSLPEFLGLGDGCTDAADNDGDGDTDAADDGCRDPDGDTVPELVDNCPEVSSINVLDSDNDGVGDVCEAQGDEHTWGDNNCSGAADPVDALLALRHDAGQPSNTGDCPPLGGEVDVEGQQRPWGDVDCSGVVDPIDGLKLLRHDSGLSVSQEPACPGVGSSVVIAQASNVLAWWRQLF